MAFQEKPFAYFITFTCYGARLPGNPKGYVDRFNNIYDTPFPEANEKQLKTSTSRVKQDPYILDNYKRNVVLTEIIQTCLHFNWELFAAHVRSNHVHVVLQADQEPEYTMNRLKSYASRAINKHLPDESILKKWARHGSTKRLWGPKSTDAVIHYVLHEQGRAMAVYKPKIGDAPLRSRL